MTIKNTRNIIGREKEKQKLSQFLNSVKAEFMVVYGRRRIGKTYLIRQYFENSKNLFFNATGMKEGKLEDQTKHFSEQIGRSFFNGMTPKAGTSWEEVFKLLTDVIEQTKKIYKAKKIVLFLDEFPWMASKNSKLLEKLDYYWNQHWSNDDRIKLIICGSSASWIIDKIIYNKGGLHNRVTYTLQLEPFTLGETRKFLSHLGFKINHRQVTQVYMITGGVPHYLAQLNSNASIDQNIDEIAFSKNSFLFSEFDKLFSSLFDDVEAYLNILKILAAQPLGMGQAALFETLKIPKGQGTLSKLKSLEICGFIMSFTPYGHKEKGTYYKIIDEYTLFYFAWLAPLGNILSSKGLGQHYWEKRKLTPEWLAWSGYAFESLCHKHSMHIAQALGISASSVPGTWRYIPKKNSTDQGAQIDLLFDRDDDAITLCEIKYTENPLSIDKAYAKNLTQKMEVFRERTKTTKQLFLALISAAGLKKSIYSEELVNHLVTLDHLFID